MNGPWRNRSASDQSPGTCSPPACDDWRFRPRTSSRTRARAGPRFRSGRPPRPAGDRRDRPGAPEPLFETAHSHFESGKEVVDALDPVEAGSHQVGFRQGRVLDGGREPGAHRGTAPPSLKKASPDCAAGRGSEDAFGTPAHDAIVRATDGRACGPDNRGARGRGGQNDDGRPDESGIAESSPGAGPVARRIAFGIAALVGVFLTWGSLFLLCIRSEYSMVSQCC